MCIGALLSRLASRGNGLEVLGCLSWSLLSLIHLTGLVTIAKSEGALELTRSTPYFHLSCLLSYVKAINFEPRIATKPLGPGILSV